MQITKQELRAWRVGPYMYRWFIRNFPDGGKYADVHSALIQYGYVDWATSLVEYAYSLWLEKENFAYQETNATDLLAEVLSDITPQVKADRQALGIQTLPLTGFIPSDNSPYTRKLAADIDNFKLMDIYNSSQIGCAGDSARIGSTGHSARISGSGVNVQIGSSGEYAWLSSSGYSTQIASSGYGVRAGCVGHDVRVGSSGDRARIATAGNSSKVSSSGRGVRIASAGMRARIGSVGDSLKVASSGDLSHISSFGEAARVVSAGDNSRIVAMGEHSLVASAGSIDYVVLGNGGCASVAYFDGKRMRFAVAYEGEGNIRAGVKYRLNDNHQFVEYSA